MPPRKASVVAQKAAKSEAAGPLLGPDEVLAALAVREPFGELPPSLLRSVEALVQPPPPLPPTAPLASEPKTPAVKPTRSTRVPATAPPVAAAGSSRARTRTAEAALPTPPPTPALPPRPETIRLCMQLVNALLSLLAAPATAAASKESIGTLVGLAGLALDVLRRGLTRETERVGVEKACTGLAGRLGIIGAKEAALALLWESRSIILDLYASSPSPVPTSTPAVTRPAASAVLQTPARRRILSAASSVSSAAKATSSASTPLPAPLPAPLEPSALAPATANLLLSYSATLLSLAPLHPAAPALLLSVYLLAPVIPPATLPPLLMPLVRALSSPPAAPTSTAISIFDSRSSALDILQLVHTLKPAVYWDQLTRFVRSFIGKCEPGLDEYARVSTEVAKRVAWSAYKGPEWRQGKVWDDVVQLWRAVASRAGEADTLQTIVVLLEAACGPEVSAESDALAGDLQTLNLQDGPSCPTPAPKRKVERKERLNVPQALTVLAQVSLKLEAQIKTPSDAYDAGPDLRQARSVIARLVGACPPADLGPVGRGLERVRKASAKSLETCSNDALRKEASDMIDSFVLFAENAVRQTTEMTESLQRTLCDLIYSSADSLLLLARTTFDASQRPTHAAGLALINRALALLTSVALSVEDRAKLKRFLSGTAYHFGGKIYKEGRAVDGLALLQVGCSVAQEALQDWKARLPREGADAAEAEAPWTALASELGKRWELLGTVWLKKEVKTEAYKAYVAGVKSIPTSTFALLASHATALSPAAIVALQAPPLVLLFSLVNRLTIVAHFDLALPPSEISVRALLAGVNSDVSNGAMGALLEYQLSVISGALGKSGVASLALALINDAEAFYEVATHPVRRLRVVTEKIRCLATCASEESVSHQDLDAELEAYSTAQDLGEDGRLVQAVPLSLGSGHLWLARLAHATSSDSGPVLSHALEGLRFLRIVTPGLEAALEKEKARTPVRKAALRDSTRQPAAAPPLTTRKRIARGAIAPKSPPKIPMKTPRHKVSVVEAEAPVAAVAIEGLDGILDLLDMTANLLGFLGEPSAKIQILKLVRSLSLRKPQYIDIHLMACGALGVEYARLSKVSRASIVFSTALPLLEKPIDGYSVTPAAKAVFLLQHCTLLAHEGEKEASVTAYQAALSASRDIQYDSKLVGSARLREKTAKTERTAMAHEAAASIYLLEGNLALATTSLSQAHRLWNSVVKNVARLTPKPTATPADSPSLENPFQVEPPKSAVPAAEQPSKDAVEATRKEPISIERRLNSVGARSSEGLLNCLLSLAMTLIQRGSPREADLYLQQLTDLATNGGSPTMAGRALSRRALLALQTGKADEAATLLEQSRALLQQDQHAILADLLGTEGRILELCDELGDAQASYDAALRLLMEAETAFEQADKLHPIASTIQPLEPVYLPLLATLLRQKALVLLGLNAQDGLGKRLSGSPQSYASTSATLSEDLSHDARQILRRALDNFKADLTMSSLTESSISIPMGFLVGASARPSKARKDANLTLSRAEEAFCKALEHCRASGHVQQVREACLSLSALRALQTSMGQDAGPLATKTSWCLDHCSAVTLRRELLEAILNKTPRRLDDLSWPLPFSQKDATPPTLDLIDADHDHERPSGQTAWGRIAARHEAASLEQQPVSTLPASCCVITINVSDDLTTLFISRRSSDDEPIVFSLPLDRQGRREGEEEHFSFSDATEELAEIIGKSNDTARNAKDVDSKQGKLDWWAERRSLDKRMEELLNNIEFCWLGAFRSIFNRPSQAGPEAFAAFRTKVEDLFSRALSSSRRSGPQVKIDDNLLGCFATLRSTSRDEELEDLVYFVLDLYQVHGQAVALAEVDVDQLVIDVRTILEEQEHHPVETPSPVVERNIYLVLDRHCQPIPWESMPSLRGQSITRIPSTHFLDDRVLLHKAATGAASPAGALLRPLFNRANGLYILNPSGDLTRTQKTFEPWTTKMDALGWTGIVGRAPSEDELVHALQNKDVVVYFGHGGAEQYVQSRKIRHLRRCATVMLWGCSSGHLKDQGEFDRAGVPWNYMVAGCPSLVANLWDVTDRDIDRLSEAVLASMGMADDASAGSPGHAAGLSTAEAVAAARTECKLRFLTGAAPVVYGVPAWAA